MPEFPIIVTVDDAKNPSLLFRLLTTLADKISQLGAKIDQLGRHTDKTIKMSEVQAALQSTGVAPLNVTGLRGVLADPQPASALRYDSVPSGPILQQLKDTQLLVVKNGSAYDLYHVLGGNPNTLFKLIGGASGGSMMTTDTDQTVDVGVQKTWRDTQVIATTVAGSLGLNIENTNTGTSSHAKINLATDAGSASINNHALARTVSRFGLTLGGWWEFLAASGLAGIVIGTAGADPIVFGTNDTEAARFDSSQNLELKQIVTKYDNIATVKGGMPSIIAFDQITNQTADSGSRTLYTTPNPAPYMYIALVTLTTHTAGTAGSTVNASVSWTDSGGTARGHLALAHGGGAFGCDLTTATGTATGTAVIAVPGNAINITWATLGTYNGGAAYNAYVELLAL